MQPTVLVVDDDAFQRSLLRRLLVAEGAVVVDAPDGMAALELLADTSFSLCVVDLNMPRMDGVALLRHIAELPNPPPIAVVSGEDAPVLETVKQLALAHLLRVVATLSKPVRPGDLSTALADAISAGDKDGPARLGTDEVKTGIRDGRIVVHYQPKVRLSDGALVGVEALARFEHGERGILSPAAFVGIAETGGFSLDLTRNVLSQAAHQATAWREAGYALELAVNVSVADLHDQQLVEEISTLLSEHDLPPHQLSLELTESRLLGPETGPIEILTRLRLRGVHLAIDDFGTGASTITQLRRLPFSTLKIDRAFVHGASQDEQARAMLEASVQLAERMELTTVAEGVETLDDLKLIMDLGIHVVQGYLIARPMPAADLIRWADQFRELPWPPAGSTADLPDA